MPYKADIVYSFQGQLQDVLIISTVIVIDTPANLGMLNFWDA